MLDSGLNKRQSQTLAPVVIPNRSFSYRWFYNQQIVVVTINSFPLGTLNAWIDMMTSMMRNWPSNRPYLAMICTEVVSSSFELYLERPNMNAIGSYLNIHGREALVMPESYLVPQIEMLIHDNLLRRQPNLERKIFFNPDDGLAWLKEALPSPLL